MAQVMARNGFIILFVAFLCSCTKQPQGKLILRIDGDKQQGSGLGTQVFRFSDVNDDGMPEIVAAAPFERANDIGVYCGRTGNLLHRVEKNREEYLLRYFTVVRDLNGDGISDLVSPDTWFNRGLWFFSGKDGTPLFKAKVSSPTFVEPRVIVTPDKNGDSHPDVAIRQEKELWVISGSDGSILDKTGPLVDTDEYVQYNRMPDVDGDGFDDIVAFLDEEKRLDENRFMTRNQMWYLSSGSWKIVQGPVDLPLNQTPRRYTFADVNADGIVDAVCCDIGGGKPAGSVLLVVSGRDGSELWRVNGADVAGGSAMARVDVKTGEVEERYSDIQFGECVCVLPDINGDGVADIATGHPTLHDEAGGVNGCIYLFSGKDGQILDTIWSPDRNTRIGNSLAAFADADLDGRPDLLAGAQSATVDGKKKVGSILIFRL
jgi:hypothetical protein